MTTEHRPASAGKPHIPQALLADTKIKGVFSSQTIEKVGTGSTTRRTISKMYWYALEKDNGQIEIQPLNKNYVPAGPKRDVAKDEFLAKFNPEPEFYVSTVYPRIKELDQTVTRAEEARAKGANYSAEFEFKSALNVDEENVRANFGLGLTYMARGETNKANDIFERVVKLDAAFQVEHKHLFNEFGMNLRKSGMQDQAIDYYSRALNMTKDDENLYYNMARAYYEKGDLARCEESLTTALKINPQHEEAQKFMQHVKSKKRS